MASSKDFSVMTTFQSVGLVEEETFFGEHFSKLVFYDSEDGLSGSSGRHVDFKGIFV
jgi:hypothetical protein